MWFPISKPPKSQGNILVINYFQKVYKNLVLLSVCGLGASCDLPKASSRLEEMILHKWLFSQVHLFLSSSHYLTKIMYYFSPILKLSEYWLRVIKEWQFGLLSFYLYIILIPTQFRLLILAKFAFFPSPTTVNSRQKEKGCDLVE